MDIFCQIAIRIIKEQELVIGPLAWREAEKVNGLRVLDPTIGAVAFDGDAKQAIDGLVARYDRLFGRASHEVSRGAAAALLADLTPTEIPASLKT